MRFSIIVPTLNEANHLPRLLTSLRSQTLQDYEVIVVDDGSTDGTPRIAKSFGADVYVRHGSGEFGARNVGAKHASGSLFIFTCADVVFPATVLERLELLFGKNPRLAAITVPGVPYDGPVALKMEYRFSNLTRFIFSKLPHPLTRFITSTNFLALRKEAFERIGGFRLNDVNADGLMGRTLAKHYRIQYDHDANVYVSSRRAQKSGLVGFNTHYIYVLEDYIPSLSRRQWFAQLKERTLHRHKELHLEAGEPKPKNN